MGFGELLGGLASLGTTAYQIYAGEKASNTANQQYEIANELSKEQAQLARDQWATYQDRYGPLEDKQVEEAIADIELWRPYKHELLNEMQRNIEMYRPIEDKMVAEAQEGVDPETYARNASQRVALAFDKADDITARNMTRQGIDPSSGRTQAALREVQINRALADAAAQTEAFQTAKDTDWNRMGAALGYRQGYAMPQTYTPSGGALATQAQSGLAQAGNTAQALGNTAANAAASNWSGAMYALNPYGNTAAPGSTPNGSGQNAITSTWNAASDLFNQKPAIQTQ